MDFLYKKASPILSPRVLFFTRNESVKNKDGLFLFVVFLTAVDLSRRGLQSLIELGLGN